MLSGSQITDAVLKHAATMLRQAEGEPVPVDAEVLRSRVLMAWPSWPWLYTGRMPVPLATQSAGIRLY